MTNRNQYKCIVLGDAGVGKTSILLRYIEGTYMTQPYTVGVDFHSKNVEHLKRHIQLHLWDTAGQERYRSLIPSYLQRTIVFFMIYDCTQRKTFENLTKIWLPLIKEAKDDHKCLVYLVSAKNDRSQYSMVSEREHREFEILVREDVGNRLMQTRSFHCSALANTGINEMFNQVLDDIVLYIEKYLPRFYTKADLRPIGDIRRGQQNVRGGRGECSC